MHKNLTLTLCSWPILELIFFLSFKNQVVWQAQNLTSLLHTISIWANLLALKNHCKEVFKFSQQSIFLDSGLKWGNTEPSTQFRTPCGFIVLTEKKKADWTSAWEITECEPWPREKVCFLVQTEGPLHLKQSTFLCFSFWDKISPMPSGFLFVTHLS